LLECKSIAPYNFISSPPLSDWGWIIRPTVLPLGEAV
jgi:hypothetical protein